ncbi:hypothetical protein [Clostridium tagluense]|nr:hypothetical protein [Clostridium tagluense]
MRILVGQPIHEKNADQLEKEIKNNPNIDMIIYYIAHQLLIMMD